MCSRYRRITPRGGWRCPTDPSSLRSVVASDTISRLRRERTHVPNWPFMTPSASFNSFASDGGICHKIPPRVKVGVAVKANQQELITTGLGS